MLHERHETIFDQKLRQRRRREIKVKRNKQKHNQGAFTIKLTLKIFFGVVFLYVNTQLKLYCLVFLGVFPKALLKLIQNFPQKTIEQTNKTYDKLFYTKF